MFEKFTNMHGVEITSIFYGMVWWTYFMFVINIPFCKQIIIKRKVIKS